MKVDIPEESPRWAAAEIAQAARAIRQRHLESAVECLSLDTTYNVCSVEFTAGASMKDQHTVMWCIHQFVSTYESDGVICSGVPMSAGPPPDEDDEDEDEYEGDDETSCPACRGTKVDDEGDICDVCYGLERD